MSRFNSLSLIAFIGDVTLLLMFSAIGRTSHNDRGALAVIGVVGTAAPFLIGWTVVAFALGGVSADAFGSIRKVLIRLLWTWPIACAIGIGIRSVLEGRLTHIAFMFVALLFNLATFGIWHSLLTWWHRKEVRTGVPATA